MAEDEDLYKLNGNSYRGSRYANFSSGAAAPNQGTDVTQHTSESTANQTGQQQQGSVGVLPTSSSQTSTVNNQAAAQEIPSMGQMAKDVVIGAGIPMAGKAIGTAIGSSLATGGTLGAGLSNGVSALGNTVSAGLLGSPAASATNAALSGMGGAYGPATSSAVSKAASGANLGGAAGAGLGTAAATLLMGGSVGDAVKSGAGSAIGTYIGTAVGGPIGGFIGGMIGSIFCFSPETPILMEDGQTTKPISELKLNDVVYLGGRVTAHGQAFSDEIYKYNNTFVTGTHAVFENGTWMRVEDSSNSVKMHLDESYIVCPVETENHLLVTPWFISADITEVADSWNHSEDERIEILNSQEEINAQLVTISAGLDGLEHRKRA